MTTEHQSVLAQMARLQGTIDECKKNLQQGSNNNNNNNNPTTSSAANQPPPSNYYSRVNSALPHVTKTTWKLASNRQQANNLIRPHLAGRSTKLILNRPTPTTTIQPKPTTSQLPTPTNITPSSSAPITTTLSVSAQPFKPSSAPTSNQPTTTNNLVAHDSTQTPPISLAPTAQNMTPSPVAQTATNLSNMSLAPNHPPAPLTRSPASATAITSNELLIDGVSFVRDTQGKKLVRKTELVPAPPQPVQHSEKPAPVPSTSAPDLNVQKATPIKALIGGMTYVRTKSGNLVELSALKKFQAQRLQEIKRAKLLATVNAMKSRYASSASRPYPPPPSSSLNNTWGHKKLGPQPLRHSKVIATVARPPVIKKNEQCRFFAKTGACRNGLTCVYQHDPLQVAICSRYLRKKCSYSATSCPLSHKPNPHNMEHCSHFPRCNKADCPYPHVKPTSSQICPEFADLGWCSKGAQCTERHVRECPEFSSKGTCSNPGCRLRHMISRNHHQNENLEESPSHQEDEDHRMTADDEAGLSDEEAPDTAGSAGLFFTDLTGTHDPKGKRKAPSSKAPVDPHHHQQRTFKGISHNTEVGSPTVKRIKYDQMADNSDFVMFISSDEEQGTSPVGQPTSSKKDHTEPVEISSEEDNDDEEEEEEGEGEKDVEEEEVMDVEEHESAVDPSSVDSEELDSVLMDHHHLLSLDHHHPLEDELEGGCGEEIHEEAIPDERIHEERIPEDADNPFRVEQIQEDQGRGFLEAKKEDEEDDKPLPTPTHPLPPRPPSPCFPASPGPLIFSAHRAPLSLFPLTPTPSHHHPQLAPPPLSPVVVVKPRNRSSLEPGEEIEEGEIFDDDDEEEEQMTQDPPSGEAQVSHPPAHPHGSLQQPQLAESSVTSHSCSMAVEEGLDSEDDDELVARLLLGNPHHHFF
ncbi:hypothetical protein PGT21_017657 [Puccinia graminis f. sp. tritici]|uniref:C3H1-type domain-containing protein n=1 Tax=Puccinia graminis f. sp. tritici TaxID=56615 RepID=A0A5B0LW13_PUCGR|nr:hypothetical protein PGTUg99_035050 [Puccinia graminis f. sp. tritici]KAA1104268.1 hypothetical protein PGT21_017657 [Puccinia graminis f. sp. tritici]